MKKSCIALFFLLQVTAMLQAQSAQFFQFYFYGSSQRLDALMSIENNDISVWVKYYDYTYRQYVVTHETCTAVNSENGIAILCENPVYDGTSRAASYSPDNFFIGKNEYGRTTMFNLDDQGVYSAVFGLKRLSTKTDLILAYRNFTR